MCDDIKDLDLLAALQQLLELFTTMSKDSVSLSTKSLNRQLVQWIESLPSYIKGSLDFSMCHNSNWFRF